MLALNGYYISFLTIGVLSMAMNPIGQGSDRNSDVGRPRRNVVPREVEGVRLERLRTLRNSRAGYLGAMNRSQKDIELLLMDFANYEAVLEGRNSVNKIFNDYTKCCQDYEACLNSDETVEYNIMKDEYTSVSKNREELERRLEEWIKFVQDRQINDLADNILQTELRTSRSNELGGSTPKFASPSMRESHELINMSSSHLAARDNLDDVGRSGREDLKTADALSVGSKRSIKSSAHTKSSLRSDEARFRRIKAQMDKKHRMEMQEIERQQQIIDRKLEMMHIKQEVEVKRAELQRKRELLQLQNDIEQAQLDEEVDKLSNVGNVAQEDDPDAIMNDRSPQRSYVLRKEIPSPPIPLRTDTFAPNVSHRNWQRFKPGEAERRNVERREAEQRDAERREAEQRDVELREQERRRMERRETVLQDVDHRISQRHSERLEMDYCEANQRTCHMFSSRNQQPYQTMTENRRTVPRQGERLDVHEANESTMHGCEPGYSEQLQRVLQRQQESLITMAQTLGTSIFLFLFYKLCHNKNTS